MDRSFSQFRNALAAFPQLFISLGLFAAVGLLAIGASGLLAEGLGGRGWARNLLQQTRPASFARRSGATTSSATTQPALTALLRSWQTTREKSSSIESWPTCWGF